MTAAACTLLHKFLARIIIIPLADLSVVAEDNDGEEVAEEPEERDGRNQEAVRHVLEAAHAHHFGVCRWRCC